MEILIDKSYPVGVDPEVAWDLLCNLPSVAICMPGAELTDKLGEGRYKGKVKVKVGPAGVSFIGEIGMLEIDQEARQVQMGGKGADKGGSLASLHLTARIEEAEGDVESVIIGLAKINVKGKFAQYGERMMIQVADMVVAQFVENFTAAAMALSLAEGGAENVLPTDKSAIRDAIPEQNRELNGLEMLWRLVKAWFADLFGKLR